MTTFLSWCRSRPDNRVTGSWIPFNRPEMFLPQGGLFKDTPPFCQPCQCVIWGGGGEPQGNCSVLILSKPSPHQAGGSMNQTTSQRKEEKAFRIILGRERMGPFQNKRKEENMNFSPFIFRDGLQFTPDKAVRNKAPVTGLWLPWQLLAVCRRLRLL